MKFRAVFYQALSETLYIVLHLYYFLDYQGQNHFPYMLDTGTEPKNCI